MTTASGGGLFSGRPLRSIRSRLFGAMAMLCTACLAASLVVSIYVRREAWFEQTTQDFARASLQVNSMVEMKTGELRQILFSLMLDENVRKLFADNYASNYDEWVVRTQVDQLLTNLHSHYQPLCVYLVLAKPGLVYTNYGAFQAQIGNAAYTGGFNREVGGYSMLDMPMESLTSAPWYDSIMSSPRLYHSMDDFSLPGLMGGRQLFTQLYRYQIGGQFLGFIALSVDGQWLDPIFQHEQQRHGEGVYVLGNTGKVLYHSPDAPDLLGYVDGDLADGTIRTVRLDGVEYIMQQLDAQGLHMLFFADKRPLNQAYNGVIQSYVLIGVLLMLIAGVIAYILARNIAAPITTISTEIGQYHSLHQSIVVPRRASSEIDLLVRCINGQAERILELADDLYSSQLLHKEAEIVSLKQQTNPHFLYNTIETINSIALLNSCHDICGICEHLGDMLRYSLQNEPEETTLGQEIEHIQNYLAIMRFRNSNFDYHIDIPPALLGLRVQRLILQPIVENCVRHGFVMLGRHGLISVKCEAAADSLTVFVRDNGAGIANERLDVLRDSLCVQHHPGARENIGLGNVHWRIRLRHGAGYGLTIESGEGQGTCCRIVLPYIE